MIDLPVLITTTLLLVFFGFTLWIAIKSNNRTKVLFLPLAVLLLIIRQILAIYDIGSLQLLSYRSEPLLTLFLVLIGGSLVWNFSSATGEMQGIEDFSTRGKFIGQLIKQLENASSRNMIYQIYAEAAKHIIGELLLIVYTRDNNNAKAFKQYYEISSKCRGITGSLYNNWSKDFTNRVDAWIGGHIIVALSQKQTRQLNIPEEAGQEEGEKQAAYLVRLETNTQFRTYALLLGCQKITSLKTKTLELITSLVINGLANYDRHQKAKSREKRDDTLLNRMPYMVAYKDGKDRWKFFNTAACTFFNINYETYYNKTSTDLQKINNFHKSLFSFFKKQEIKCRQENKIVTGRKTLKTDRGVKSFEASFIPMDFEKEQQISLILAASDITEMEQNRLSLYKNEKQLRELISQLPKAVLIMKNRQEVEYINKEFTALFGYKLSEISNIKEWFQKAYPDQAYREKVILDWKNSLHLNNPRYLYKVHNVHSKQGKKMRIRVQWGYLSNEKIYFLLEDISKEHKSRKRDKQTQQNLIRLSRSALEMITLPSQEELFEYIGKEIKEYFSNSRVLFNIIDKQSKYAYLHRYFGITHEAINQIIRSTGLDPYQYFFRLKPYLKLVMLKGKLTMLKRGFGALLEGEVLPEMQARLQQIVGGSYLYIIGLVRNGIVYGNMLLITPEKVHPHSFNFVETFMHQASIAFHQKELEKELIHAKEKAEESDKLKLAFLANVSHEVRTPMNSIMGFSELLADPNYSDEKKKEHLEVINDNSRQLMKLMTDIVDISKIEAKQISLEYAQVNIHRMLDNLYSSFKNELAKQEKSHLNLILKKAYEDKDFVVLTDEFRLKQILINLLNNALKFTNKGEIEFGYQLNSSDKTLFYVRDTGLGIDPMNKEIIFERFRQGTENEIIKNTGTGLGLSISKGLVELMSGTIWFESLKFKGTTFYFELPLEEIHTQKIMPNENAPIIIDNWEEKSILVVEDHHPSFLYMKHILEKAQVNVSHTESANKAVEMLSQDNYYDLILMDIRTPDGSGLDATRKIKEMHPNIHIVAQTAYAMEEDQQRCMDAGCDDYLVKPFSKDQLLSMLDKYL